MSALMLALCVASENHALGCLCGSLKQLDYKVNSTGTEDNSILLRK